MRRRQEDDGHVLGIARASVVRRRQGAYGATQRLAPLARPWRGRPRWSRLADAKTRAGNASAPPSRGAPVLSPRLWELGCTDRRDATHPDCNSGRRSTGLQSLTKVRGKRSARLRKQHLRRGSAHPTPMLAGKPRGEIRRCAGRARPRRLGTSAIASLAKRWGAKRRGGGVLCAVFRPLCGSTKPNAGGDSWCAAFRGG